jgi:hypothetical protein
MALGVEGTRTSRVLLKIVLLTFGTLLFVTSLTLVYLSMRAVMDVGGACASGGAYEISTPCPDGVAWAMPLGIFGMIIGGGLTLVGVFSQGGPRPYVFAWSALFLALGWNFLDYGFNPPDGSGASAGWLICGFIFVAMGGVPLLFLLSPRAVRWSLWGPDTSRADDHLHPYKPPPVRKPPTPTDAVPADAVPTPASPFARAGTVAPFVPPAPAAAPVEELHATDVVPPERGDVVDRLATLADLRQRGMLDDDEYEQAKAAVLREESTS